VAELTEKLKYYLNTNTSDYVKKIKELKQLNDKQKTELNELKTKINNTNLSKNDSLSVVNPGEKIIAIKFECPENNINFPMACKNTDIISRLEEKLYDEYPEFKEFNTYLMVNGNLVKRFKTLDENGIKNRNSIIVNIYDE
jgi:hypothetical protein